MEKSVYLAGVGGQGLQLAGKVLVSAADRAGYKVTYSPKYGYEKRGGLSSCYLVFSDDIIGNPRKNKHDVLVTMEPKVYKQLHKNVNQNGTLIVNQSLIEKPEQPEAGAELVEVDFYRCCAELGGMIAISMVVVGVVVAVLPEVFLDTSLLETCIEKVSKKPAILEMNKAAFWMGYKQYNN